MGCFAFIIFIFSALGAFVCFELGFYDWCVWLSVIAGVCLIIWFFKLAFSLEWKGENNGHDPYDID